MLARIGCGIMILLLAACSQQPEPAPALFAGHAVAINKHGQKISYLSNSVQGPRVLLLSSLGRSVADYSDLAGRLGAAGYHVTAVDVRGVGASDLFGNPRAITLYDLAKDVQQALRADGWQKGERLVVIGHAFGNRLARALAHQYPDEVRGVVLLAAGGAQNIQDDPKAWKSLLQSFDLDLPEADHEAAIRYAFFAEGNKIPVSWRGGWFPQAAKLCIAAVKNTPEAEWRAGDGKSPILVLQAADDRIAPPEHTSLLLKQQFPNRVTVVNIDHAGHALLPEQPDAIFSAIQDFLHELSGQDHLKAGKPVKGSPGN